MGKINRHQTRALRRAFRIPKRGARFQRSPESDIEIPKDDPPPPEPRAGRTLQESIEEALKASREEALEKFTSALAAATAPKKRMVPVPPRGANQDQDPQPQERGLFGHGDVRMGTDPLYLRMSKDQRDIRNPRADARMAAWLRAVRWNNMAEVMSIGRELDGEFMKARGERATTLYGTPDASSGLGGGTGGPLVPLPLANLIVLARNVRGRMRGISQIFSSNANTLRIPVSGVATAAMAAEGATAAQGEPTITSVLMSKKKAQALFAASDEMLEDSAFNLISFYTERAGGALGTLEDVQFVTSNGTAPNITQSLTSATITGVNEAVSTVLTYEDVVALFFALPQQYHSGAAFFGGSQMMQFLSTIVDGNGRPIFAPGMAAPQVVGDTYPGAIGTIFGRPVYLVPLATGSLMVGDPSYYGILDGGALTIRASEHVGWATDTIQWKITERIDGAVLLADAWREMLGITSVA